jgi:hypothetical protein
MARHNRGHAVAIGERGLGYVQSQIRLSSPLVKAMALETVLGEDRPYVAIEFELSFGVRPSDDETTSQRKEKEFDAHSQLAHVTSQPGNLWARQLFIIPRLAGAHLPGRTPPNDLAAELVWRQNASTGRGRCNDFDSRRGPHFGREPFMRELTVETCRDIVPPSALKSRSNVC